MSVEKSDFDTEVMSDCCYAVVTLFGLCSDCQEHAA